MIPQAHIMEWRTAGHPWRTDALIEQDLLISRALVALFSDKHLRDQLIFRGGTALHKLFFSEPMRYSEDIDLVQRKAEPIGPTFNRVRDILQDWMGVPQRKQGPGIATLIFRLKSEDSPYAHFLSTILRLRLFLNATWKPTDIQSAHATSERIFPKS